MITLTKFDRSVLLLNRILIGLLVLITLSPLLYVLIASFMDPFILRSQGLSLNPANWSLDGYNRVLKDPAIIRGFVNSIFYSFTYSAHHFTTFHAPKGIKIQTTPNFLYD